MSKANFKRDKIELLSAITIREPDGTTTEWPKGKVLPIAKLRLPDKQNAKSGKPHMQHDWIQTLYKGRGLILTLTYTGALTWSVLFYDDRHRPQRKKLGKYPAMNGDAARKAAMTFSVEEALASAKAGSFEAIAEKWFKHHVEPNGLRTASEKRRHLERYVYPFWRNRPFTEIDRADVNDLLDHVVEKRDKRGNRSKSGNAQADAVLSTIRSIMEWYQTRDQHYTSPIVRKMKRHRAKARDRILSHEEIADLWKAANEMGGQDFGAIVKLCLLTGQRSRKVASIRWHDIDWNTGEWTITSEEGEKVNAGVLRLPQMALDIIEWLNPDEPDEKKRKPRNRLGLTAYVFPVTKGRKKDNGPFGAWTLRKRELDDKLPVGTPHWTVHDLRRTARSLMAEIGIADRVAEMVLGHVIPGIEGTYNRHKYTVEKGKALAALAEFIDRIVEGGTVIPMREPAAAH